MRRFEALVMSPTEPVTDGTLWLKEKKSPIKDSKPNEIPSIGIDIWYFGDGGWQTLVDFDTRYSLNNLYKFTAELEPVRTEVTPHHDVGIVDVDKTYFLYDGSRTVGNYGNIVNETGLKKHVDDLQSQIDILKGKVKVLEDKVATLEGQVSSHSTQINNNKVSINGLTSRVSALESVR